MVMVRVQCECTSYENKYVEWKYDECRDDGDGDDDDKVTFGKQNFLRR